MICVLLPFWTSLLVRTVAWMVMLQQKGVFNNLMVMAGLIADENRWQLMYNQTAVIIRSEEHTSELQSLVNLVCRLLLEKKKNTEH